MDREKISLIKLNKPVYYRNLFKKTERKFNFTENDFIDKSKTHRRTTMYIKYIVTKLLDRKYKDLSYISDITGLSRPQLWRYRNKYNLLKDKIPVIKILEKELR